ncbi:MAG: flippase-like domain-containing protein [Mediterranea sp.]|jgi:uncharacterized protein (TIRG00374 family)|nr:flippase-like domain-containing protein [Mediterranea sp.]
MKKLLKKTFKIVVPLLFGGAIMVWVYRDFDFSKARQVLLHEMNWWWMLFSLVFGVFSHIFRGWRWKQTLEPLGAYPKTSNCVNAIFASYAANLLVPRLGEVSRCGILSRYDGISFSRLLGTVVTERLIDSLCIGLATAVAVSMQMKVFRAFFKETGTNMDSITDVFTSPHFYIILCCLIGMILLLYFLVRALSFFEKVKGVALNIWAGIISLKDVRNKALFVCYTFLIWFCYFMQFYMTFFCFDFTASLTVPAGLVMFVGGSIAVMVPTPNGAGPWHFAVISMMTLYGVSAVDAGIFALVVHGIQTFLIILLGIYGSVTLPIINKKHNL